jgi:two-component system chemotaxis response regulator CheB
VGSTAGGVVGLRAVAELRPAVIVLATTTSLGARALETTHRIMRETPTPIVLVTASANPDERLHAAALDAGVLAVAALQHSDGARTSSAQRLIRTVKSMAEVKVIRRSTPRSGAGTPASRHPRVPEVVGIGASTGGPQALQVILSALPASFPLPVLVVQHTAAGFDSTLVDWLGSTCALPVRLAAAGQRLLGAEIWIAPTGWHLVVEHRTLTLTSAPPVAGHRPSATVLFQSLAREYGSTAIGVLLTGMADDGAAGLYALKAAGAVTIAQDEASSVVFGMPAAAIGLGVVDHILPPARVAALLVQLAARDRQEQT